MKNVYCTYFNRGYLCRGIVLIRSLARVEPGFAIEVLCFDDFTYDFLANHPFGGVVPVRLADFEARHPELVAVKPTRTTAEYFFTCTSSWTLDVARRNASADFITYLDADMKFFSSPAPVFERMAGKDVLICDHNFERPSNEAELHGRFNVGWLTFRTSELGLECLSTWAESCIAWCFDQVEDGKFADQKYLDDWPARYGDRLLVGPKSLDLGPWGVGSGEISKRADVPCICGEPVVTYHYQGLRLLGRRHYLLGYHYDYSIVDNLRILYDPYLAELRDVAVEFGLAGGGVAYRKDYEMPLLPSLIQGYWAGYPRISNLIRILKGLYYPLKSLVTGKKY